ncbi:MAG: DUF2029 domain-containing protein [Saprospiraceae bacterium]|nr:DUF2029 domain-containing protein [Saprospiraceae bacterium]
MKSIDWTVAGKKKKMVLLVAALVTMVVSFLQYRLPLKSFDTTAPRYTHYNNYVIFKQSHFHLLENQDMYVSYPGEHHDLYKYSPAFALVFGMFSNMPDLLGLTLWNVLNILFLLWVLLYRGAPWEKKAGLLLLFMIPELVLTTQHAQSNALMAGLLILSFLDLESDRSGRAAVWIVIAAFIKIYAGLGVLLFFFYPHKTKYFLTAVSCSIMLCFLPLLVTSWSSLWMQYQGWWYMLSHDHDTSYGLSLMGLLNLIFPNFHAKSMIQLLGVILTLVCLIPMRKFQSLSLRTSYLSLLLLTLIIFNHKSESATFIVAIVGIGIWYFSKNQVSNLDTLILIFSLVFAELSTSDIFPVFIRKVYFVPYHVKVWPVILVYSIIFTELMRVGMSFKKGVKNSY